MAARYTIGDAGLVELGPISERRIAHVQGEFDFAASTSFYLDFLRGIIDKRKEFCFSGWQRA